jgi:hypothetical protein
MCGWEQGAQNGIWREAGCVGGRREHKMGIGGRQDVWVGGESTKWELAGGRMCGMRREHIMGFGGRQDMGGCKEGAQNGIRREAYEGIGGRLDAGMSGRG